MTKLEEEMWLAMRSVMFSSNPNDHTKAVADVAKKYIDSVANFLIENNTGSGKLAGVIRQQYKGDYQKWLKENGIIE